jgi:phosphoglycolate phosphatase
VIGVPFGYTDVPIAALAPDAVVDHYDALDEAVRRLTPAPELRLAAARA